MLLLSRKEGERILIGEDIVLTISRISGNRVTVGIEAPNEVAVRRSELLPMVADQAPLEQEPAMQAHVA